MRKFEIYPYINYGFIGTIEATIELTDEEIEAIKSMDKKEFSKFVKEKAVVTILDADVDYEVGTFEDWDEVTND
jgi:hypothetical protein